MKIEPSCGALDIFTRPTGRELVPTNRDLVPVEVSKPPATSGRPQSRRAEGEPLVADLLPNVDVRRMSPREAAELSMDLYIAGVLPYEEHAMLAFQPELHPDFEATVGALTGQKAEPDRSRDFVAIWDERLDFERKYNIQDTKLIERTQHIVTVLRQIDSPTNVVI
jgi:hypothetical protein